MPQHYEPIEIEVDADEEQEEGLLGEEEMVIADEEERKKLVDYLCDEYEQALADREGAIKQWQKWRKAAEAEPENEVKNTPYRNASNVTPPVTQSINHTAFALLKDLFDAKDPFWTVKSHRSDDEHEKSKAKVVQRYLSLLAQSEDDLNIEQVKQEALSEASLMGTAFMKVEWNVEPWNYKYRDETGQLIQREAYTHFGPQITVAPIERVIYPDQFSEIKRLPWICYEVTRSKAEIANLAANGVYADVEEVFKHERTDKRPEEQQRDDARDMKEASMSGVYDISEFYVFWDTDGDGQFEDIKVTLHVPSRTILAMSYNDLITRDLVVAKYVNRNFAVEGRGIGKMTHSMQLESEGMHNVRNDNAKFAAMRMIAMTRSAARSNRESIYPGKVWKVDNPAQDIQPIQLGEVYPSSLQAEQNAMQLARETTGISSTMSGFSDPRLGSRDTFRGQQMRGQQGQGMFKSIATGLKSAFRQVGRLVFFQLVRHREEVLAHEAKIRRLSEEELELLDEALRMDIESVPFEMTFDVMTTDIDQSFESKRQNMLTLTQLWSQWAQEITPVAQILFGPEGQQMQQAAPQMYKHFLEVYVGGTELLNRIFEFFHEDSPEKYLPDIEREQAMRDLMRAMGRDSVEQKQQLKQMLDEERERQSAMESQNRFEPSQPEFQDPPDAPDMPQMPGGQM